MRALFLLTALFIIIGAGAAFGLKLFSTYLRAPGPLEQPRVVFIAPGTGVRSMAIQLAQEGVIAEPYAFLAAVQLQGVNAKLQAGEYEMPANISLRDTIEKLATGDVFARAVTIPEGLWSSEIAHIINSAEGLTGTIEGAPPEGTVLPDTYAYIRDEARSRILTEAQRAMTDTLNDAWEHRAEGLPFTTKEEALTLASIVEKETGIASERARIAGVFVNRLRKGMMLQSDPTVIYAVTGGQSKINRVLYAHLETESPYNTYRKAGLPPGPICNPGKAAIEAVMNPEANDYLYFVADGKGGHVFASTLDEHNANVARWRAVQRAARAAGGAAAAKAAPEAEKAPGTVPDKAVETAPKAP